VAAGDVVFQVFQVFLDVCFKYFIWMLHMLQLLYMHVASVSVFGCFKRMFQVFHLNVVKVYMDVTYTCMLQSYVSSVSYVCCKCFIWMLQK
jgi:hypothetical protein